MELFPIVVALAAISVGWYFTSFLKSYLKARKIGLPIHLTPVNDHNVFWMIFAVPLRPIFKRFLPAALFQRLELATYGFEFRVRNKPYKMFGPTYLLVGPGEVALWNADPEMNKAIAANTKEIPPSKMAEGRLTPAKMIRCKLANACKYSCRGSGQIFSS